MVWGSSRDAQTTSFSNLRTLGIDDQVSKLSMAPNDFRSVLSAIDRTQPDEIYFLAGQSSVGLSFEQPVETLESIVSGTLNILEAVRFLRRPTRVYNSSSSECFGDNGKEPCTERTPFHPRSPYGIAKAAAHWLIVNYRSSYDLFACNGVLFNHESPLRPSRFVTQKIVSAVKRIASGSPERLELGRLDIVRDWGWAPDYVQAMWLMLQKDQPSDYVIATGEANSLQSFTSTAFELLNLDWRKHVDFSANFVRPNELEWSQGSPEKASNELGWKATFRMKDVVSEMLFHS